MKIPSLSLLIGLRFKCSRYRENTISMISFVSTFGIALGVIVTTIAFSAMNGFKRELNNRILAVVPHGEIESINQPWKNWKHTLLKIKNIPGIDEAAPYCNFSGLLENGANLKLVQVRGINPQQTERLSALPKFISKKTWINFRSGENQIIVGEGVANTLKVKQNDWVSIILPPISSNYKLQLPNRIRLRITGIVQLHGQLDHSFAIIPIEDAGRYLNMKNSVTGIAVKIHDAFNASKLIQNIRTVTNGHFFIKSWINTYGYIYHDIQVIRTIIYLAMTSIISIACFNIVTILIMAVKEKTKDIAVLRTMGAKNSFIRSIFIWYGMVVGIYGTLCGSLIGVCISFQLSFITSKIEKFIDHQFLSGKIYFIDFLPSEVYWWNVIFIMVVVLLLSLLASWYPAQRASRIDPAKILSSQ